MARLLDFPNPVNEKAARSVAAGVLALSLITVVTGWWWLTVPLAYGFVARVLAGPRFSPLGRLATRVVAPRLGAPKLVPGPPKRFAQGVGVVFSLAGLVLAFAGQQTAATVILVVLAVFAGLESIVGFCAGCYVFGHLMRLGVIPEDTCEACADIRLRQSA
ncbi:DUF4395 domain-containing protein [Flexivirga sp. ID2601S]|uniref:DUF4395 domain-containing protein n=1 Tax=Flexivirga aerilata TaxID=1656889 RepID=A0A849ALR0_9MICO|nr:DUF4395 domain-containing protein [Flexivirga aerilata]